MKVYGDKDILRYLYLGVIPSSVRVSLVPDHEGALVYDSDDRFMYLWKDSQWVPQGLYGSNHQLFTSPAVETDTQGAGLYTDKINVTTTPLSTGRYSLKASYSWNHDGITDDFVSRLLFDGSFLDAVGDGIIHQQEPADSSGTLGSTGTDQRYVFERTYYPVVSTPGAKNITLQFGTTINTQPSSMWDASVELFRIS